MVAAVKVKVEELLAVQLLEEVVEVPKLAT